jgi:hypothetical protein
MRPYSTIDAVVDDFARWRLMSERLSAGQMPPATMPQPPAELREQVLDWIQAVGINEARKHAGDPGRVPARRLSNAEYNNTIRDLTGVDIQPAREFPVDPANTEGFDNSGESLTMSPSLFNKYLQAARQVSEHMLLKPDGIDFAPHPMLAETDRDRYSITASSISMRPSLRMWPPTSKPRGGTNTAPRSDSGGHRSRTSLLRRTSAPSTWRRSGTSSRSRLNLGNQKWAPSRR